MLKKHKNILRYNHGERSIKIIFIIYADMEYCWHEKIDTCHSNPEKSLPAKTN